MKTWNVFLRTMKIMGKRCPIYLAGIFFMSTGWAMFSVMSSLLMKNVVDAAQTGDSGRMLRVIIGNVVGGIVSLLVYRVAAVVYNVEAKRAYGNVCKMLFHHEVRLPYSYYEVHHSGDFMSKLSYDLDKMGSIYGSRFRRTVAPILYVIVYLVPMFALSWQITLCLIAVNTVMIGVDALIVKPLRKVTKQLSATNGRMTENLSNLLQGMEQARMYAAGKNTVSAFVKESETYAKQSNKKILYTACLEGSNNGFDLLCTLTFLLLGLYFVGEGYTTLGSLTAIYTLYSSFSRQFLQLGRYIPELIGCLTNAQNIFEFMEEAEEPENWYETERSKGFGEEGSAQDAYIDISAIAFDYREDKPLIKDYSLQIEKGESVAITGPSGCGKTTLSKLLLGLYPLKGGDIILDGCSYHSMTNEELRKKIAYVPQEPYLFNLSIKENIRIGNLAATDEEIIEAAKAANAHDFIEKLENGYDTNVGERGNKLSGGQRQRIAIARAILKKAPVVLLDEATSALDNESEQLVNDSLKSMKEGKNIIMIAHRPSTIALADRVCGFEGNA